MVLWIIVSCRALSADQTPANTTQPAASRPPASAQLATPTAEQAAFKPTLFGSTQKDAVYCTIRGQDLRMDVSYPRKGNPPFPVVVFIHGGGWSEGSKGDVTGHVGARELVERGYVLVSVDYRLAPEFRFPSMIEDVKCAIRSLRANAGKLGIDPDRVGGMGASAGGHLAALLGTSDDTAGWDSGEGYDEPYAEYSSRVQAVVDLYGPVDLPSLFDGGRADLAQSVFGAHSIREDVLVQGSPSTYINAGDPPCLILHGDRDDTVPLSQSQQLYDQLVAAGVDAQFVVVHNAGHGFPREGNGYSPSFDELEKLIADYFDEYLGA